MNIAINEAQLPQEIDTLALFSATEPPSVTRIVYSEQDLQARAWFKERCCEAGLTIREDAIGNIFAHWIGSQSDLPAIATGSHLDAIPHAGKYDGVVGVLGGLEAIRALQRSGFQPQRSIELILFSAEEPTRFGIGCFSSRLLGGVLTSEADTLLKDQQGNTLQQLRNQAGFTGPIDSVCLKRDAYAAFVELHIEQGPILERDHLQIGIVTSIAAPASFRIEIQGEGGHAGAVLMPARRDALCAASEIILAIESFASKTGAVDTVATVGICNVHPGAVNSIPSRVEITVDLRDTDETRRNRVAEQIQEACNQIAVKRNVSVALHKINADAPAQCSPHILQAIEEICNQESISYQKMVSRAYHDSLFMARIAPIAMIFIPCRGGVSHRPDEYASPEDISRGVKVLAQTLARLSHT